MKLVNDIWWTRKSRIQTEGRLLSNERQSQLLLLWYAFFSVSVSVYYLKFNSSSEYASFVWVVLSVFSLCISGYVSTQNFKGRAGLIKECYEELGLLHEESKGASEDMVVRRRYNEILGLCENHEDIDYRVTRCRMHLSGARDLDPCVGPYDYFCAIFYFLKRLSFLLVLYFLPLFIFLFLEWKALSDFCRVN